MMPKMSIRIAQTFAFCATQILIPLTSLYGETRVETTLADARISLVRNSKGPVLGYSKTSGLTLLSIDNLTFKDLNRNGQLNPYEDWRLSFEERAEDLASKMTIEQIAGLMLYSAHQSIPARAFGPFGNASYGGKPFDQSGAAPWKLSDDQKKFLTDDNLRHVLITRVQSPEVAAKWNNQVQSLVEGIGLGIPANNSSDPRHETRADQEFNAGSGGDISMWPSSIGLAATFDPGLVAKFGEIASKEYRALGITTALSPQIDIATDPRWFRFFGTFGPNPQLAADMARAYVDGFQSSVGDAELEQGWGVESVNAMVKHWPGGGSGEGGRDAHYGFGKYAVFPGGDFELHQIPFTEGAFKLNRKTGMASAVMPYYTISFEQDDVYGENVGNAFSTFMIKDLLRGKYGYEGVICTDWGVTSNHNAVDEFGKTPWGVEQLTEVERHYKILMAGVDQFGGNNQAGPVIEAYEMGVEEHGEAYMRERFKESAVRLLLNIFRVGLFENPYLNPAHTTQIVGNPDFMEAGYEAQLKSVVLLKNKNDVLPFLKHTKVYIPQRFVPETQNFFGMKTLSCWEDPFNREIVAKYVELVEDPAQADVALVVVHTPDSGGGYDKADVQAGGNGYLPKSLQYQEYTAEYARKTSVAGGDPLEEFTNRSYKGKSVKTSNSSDLEAVLNTRKQMEGKPVIVVMNLKNPTVVAEFEAQVDAILVSFGVQDQAIFDILSGAVEPSGLLPMQMPANMRTVEEQFEDRPLDMVPHQDSKGNSYDFGFGLNWSGVIRDARTAKYLKN